MMTYVSKVSSCPFNPMYNELLTGSTNSFEYPANKPKPLISRVKKIPDFMRHVISSEYLPCVKRSPPWVTEVPKVDKSSHSNCKAPLAFRKEFMDITNSKYFDFTITYTDGSKTTNITSCAHMIDQNTRSFGINDLNTVFSTEITAIFLCLQKYEISPCS